MAASSNKKTTKNTQPRILNKRATYDYAIEERYEAGLVLHGWEVKSVRAGRAQINLAHIYIRDGAASGNTKSAMTKARRNGSASRNAS